MHMNKGRALTQWIDLEGSFQTHLTDQADRYLVQLVESCKPAQPFEMMEVIPTPWTPRTHRARKTAIPGGSK